MIPREKCNYRSKIDVLSKSRCTATTLGCPNFAFHLSKQPNLARLRKIHPLSSIAEIPNHPQLLQQDTTH
jgi:hypothetical protein